jgi:hypothetical protein
MKKLLALLAIAGFMAACNNGDDENKNGDTITTTTDTMTTPTTVDTATHMGDSSNMSHDTTTKK